MYYIEQHAAGWPGRLRGLPAMPQGLYVRGTLPDDSARSVAIVGARNCTGYGKREAKRFARTLAEHGVQIISGLAYGIDAAAHEGALEGGGKTFAVLGCGADVCYPRANRALYETIRDGNGGILSEFLPGTQPAAWHFPVRNRIVSALSDLVLVVEARRRSGSLITVGHALEQGRSVFAVPGRNGDPQSDGCNALIAQGAGIACDPEMILSELESMPWFAQGTGASGEPKTPLSGMGCVPHSAHGGRFPTGTAPERPEAARLYDAHRRLPKDWKNDRELCAVYRALDQSSRSIQEIGEEAGIPSDRIGALLVRLCLGGFAEEVTSGHFQLI